MNEARRQVFGPIGIGQLAGHRRDLHPVGCRR
ncbi:hypothetical protein PFC51_20045 [Paracoccus pantotrophus]|nr:hypothetical protein [Paracoccus pantotrophus]MDF3856543.1 hypothetical protein [Paracoccus pantotrophus]